MIGDGISQDAMEQHRVLFDRLVPITFGQFEHGILHDVQCHVFIPHRKQGMFVGSSLDIGKEFGKLFAGGQGGLLKARHDNKFL